MKSGFKPKLWTKKEWLDAAPSDKTKGSGIEVALDEWQKHCKGKFTAMTPEQAAKAAIAALKLSEALTKASRKCDPKAQKETLMGIHEYKKRADDFYEFAKLATGALVERIKYTKSMNTFKAVEKDAAALAVFGKFAQKPTVGIWAVVDGLRLFEQKKYEQAVKAYSSDGVGEGDWNIEPRNNKILHDTFVAKVRHEQGDILGAINGSMVRMKLLLNAGHFTDNGLWGMPEWKELLNQKFPIKEYSLG